MTQISSTNSQGLDEKQVPFLGVEVNIIGLKGMKMMGFKDIWFFWRC